MAKVLSFVMDLILLAFVNCVSMWKIVPLGNAVKVLLTVSLAVIYIIFIARSSGKRNSNKKLNRIDKGAFLLGNGIALMVLEIAFIIALAVCSDVHWARQLISALTAYLLITIINLCGIVRVASSARQVKIIWYVVLLMTWYIPIINIFVFKKFYNVARSEYKFEQAKLDLDDMRKENEICKTKYPILMVHGIFFRDFQYFNYWGRVPKELVRNGAEVFYGKQQSANTIEASAQEICKQIKKVLEETGAEKVNIIAHSKGGLDSRCAISKYGMDKYVASLTTINTPHLGCKFVDRILKKVPDGLMNFVDRKYNKVFSALGDENPSFRKGVYELTYENCQKFNEETVNSPDVYYHAVMSKMNGFFSAGFPLNLGYMLNKPHGTGNDGLVTVESGMWGDSPYMIEHNGKRGVSHGDVIDLMRENIPGFDVREFYVQLVKDLKEKGF